MLQVVIVRPTATFSRFPRENPGFCRFCAFWEVMLFEAGWLFNQFSIVNCSVWKHLYFAQTPNSSFIHNLNS